MDNRYGVGIAIPMQVGSTDLILIEGPDLLSAGVLMSLAIRQGELEYDTTKGSRVDELKHRHFPGTQGDAVATHLSNQVLYREDPDVVPGRATTEREGKTMRVSISFRERRYTGTDTARNVTLEV